MLFTYYLISADVNFQPTKEFLQYISAHPIKTQALGFINIDMALVPKFIMFFTTYTVIILQFNNVI